MITGDFSHWFTRRQSHGVSQYIYVHNYNYTNYTYPFLIVNEFYQISMVNIWNNYYNILSMKAIT